METTTKEITNSDDVIDVRDVIARVEELEGEVEALHKHDDKACCFCGTENEHECADCTDYEESDSETELANLTELLEELEGNGGDEQWRGSWYPVTLIRDSYATDYAQETAEDIGAIDKSANWPNNCIDWERATEEFLMDYTSVEFDGVTYWYR